MRKILYVTGTRADWGLMASTLRRICDHPKLELHVAVTGMHLSPAFGMTVGEIEASGLPIAARIASDVDSRSPAGMSRAIAQTLLGLTRAHEAVRPDVVLLLGDRGEMLAGAVAGLHLGCVVAHLHGGERSGTVDEPVRHAVSKLSHWHFAATDSSRQRLLRMGEEPSHVWVTGAPGLDGLVELGAAASRAQVLAGLGLQPDHRYILVLFHPVVQERNDAYAQTRALAGAVLSQASARGLQVVWLAPNSDAGSASVLQAVEDGAAGRVHRIGHLERPHYLQALRQAELLVGNSSSGIIEAASFGTPVVNVGTRQHGRERNTNIRDCDPDEAAIADALASALCQGRSAPANIYGDGHAGERIVRLLAEQPIAAALLHKINTY